MIFAFTSLHPKFLEYFRKDMFTTKVTGQFMCVANHKASDPLEDNPICRVDGAWQGQHTPFDFQNAVAIKYGIQTRDFTGWLDTTLRFEIQNFQWSSMAQKTALGCILREFPKERVSRQIPTVCYRNQRKNYRHRTGHQNQFLELNILTEKPEKSLHFCFPNSGLLKVCGRHKTVKKWSLISETILPLVILASALLVKYCLLRGCLYKNRPLNFA